MWQDCLPRRWGGEEFEGCISADVRVKGDARGQDIIAPGRFVGILECNMNRNMKRGCIEV